MESFFDINQVEALANKGSINNNVNQAFTYPCLAGFNFTKRELQCFNLLLQVSTTKRIAKLLGLSPRTVENYINQIKRKLGVSYKSEIIVKAFKLIKVAH